MFCVTISGLIPFALKIKKGNKEKIRRSNVILFNSFDLNHNILELLLENRVLAKTEKEIEQVNSIILLFLQQLKLNREQKRTTSIILERLDALANDVSCLSNKDISFQKKNMTTKVEKNVIPETNKRVKVSPENVITSEEDFLLILKVLEKESDPFVRARSILAHFILKIYGILLSNLKYFNIDQLDNLFNKRTVKLKSIFYSSSDYYLFHYSNEIDNDLERVRIYYNYIKRCQLENHPAFYIIDKNDPNLCLLSELWGFTPRSTLLELFNRQLKFAGNSISPTRKWTSSSYRRSLPPR